jgi:P-type E1-E2 ATPase
VAFLDPPKETAREAIAALREYGIDIKIITGDNEVVTRKIQGSWAPCRQSDVGQGCGGLD